MRTLSCALLSLSGSAHGTLEVCDTNLMPSLSNQVVFPQLTKNGSVAAIQDPADKARCADAAYQAGGTEKCECDDVHQAPSPAP
ncbi:putative secreted protein [Xanthomonas euvesicatoria pv. vesicatoria str. 85-10]|uniref:Putative secreted protein n=1 Tax=Xanthomonas euvesicatoria pv. vesicatoria (strain 85-10) TaxID=316273 RepID=Q3BSQ9_XANE5|nr:putative secreted protein [Xanthomonas euvesicatoria pv. vesicatoria str. 85-10]